MEYVQERITTLHDFRNTTGKFAGGSVDPAVGSAAVVVPMTDREHASRAAERVLTELERVSPGAVFVPVRAAPEHIDAVREWLASFDLALTVLWCNAPAVDDLLAEAVPANGCGKGRDVWLALGPAAAAGERVVVHDADARSYTAEHVSRLLAPLGMGFRFSKGYYARVEDGRLYGRLFRLFYEPLLRALAERHDAPIVDFLGSFRYALAGEFAVTAELARRLRPPPAWGLEVATLGDAFDVAGFDGTAQVDLGRHEHDHRSVGGESGLAGMSHDVAGALFRVLETHGVAPAYEPLTDRYRVVGHRLVDQYRADAAFNGLAYDPAGEREQVDRYAEAIVAPEAVGRLPSWADVALSPEEIVNAAST